MDPSALPKRLAEKVIIDHNGCWIWTGRQNSSGYGRAGWGEGSRVAYVHRITYHLLVDAGAPVFPGRAAGTAQVDHLCFTPACCNPDHLELVTPSENVRRSGKRRGWAHGVSGYIWHGCRCDECRSAYATYRRERRAAARAVLT